MNLSDYQQPEAITAALGCKRIAVVGLSSNPARASHDVTRYMLAQPQGYEIIPVNPRETEVFGLTSYQSLIEARETIGEIDMVNVFRESSAVPGIAAEAVAIGARVLWLQLGVIHSDGIELAAQAGVNVIADRCLKIEHARYL
jgi:predicted CoA-binding protein